jgi:hypothetical protein
MSGQTEINPSNGKHESDSQVPPSPAKVTIRRKGRTDEMTYQQAFVLGHALLTNREYAPAAVVFQKLIQFSDRGPRAHIMLAIGKAGLSQYAAAFAMLKGAPSLSASVAAAVYDVIVQSRMGFKNDALHDLANIVNEHKELPTLCLWLGDLLEANHHLDKAVQCWRLALKRDRAGGAVALAANRQLRRLKQQGDESRQSEPRKA